MKRAALFWFTARGEQLAGRMAALLEGEYQLTRCPPGSGALKTVGALFAQMDALLFVGACGIAVRAIAPHVADKRSDPAVVVADERGAYVISLLSGHIGGANRLARRIARGIGAQAVITTATDVNGRFSADEWAARRGLAIRSMSAARRFAAEILARDLPLFSDFPIEGGLPDGLYLGDTGACGLVISCADRRVFDAPLQLIPRAICLGIGLKRGVPGEKVESAVRAALASQNLLPQAVRAAASIDVKRGETGLVNFCAQWGLPLTFYTAGQLRAAGGEFARSDFVLRTVGVDNVCERAAMLLAGEGARLAVKKTCLDGVTVAAAQMNWRVCFE